MPNKAFLLSKNEDMDAKDKTFDQWLFDLDEHLAAEHLPLRSHEFDRGALVWGFTQKQSPEEFLKNAQSYRKPEPAASVPGAFAEAGQADRSGQRTLQELNQNVKAIRWIIGLVVFAVSVGLIMYQMNTSLAQEDAQRKTAEDAYKNGTFWAK